MWPRGNTGSCTYGNHSLICIIYKYILHFGLLGSSVDPFFFFLTKERKAALRQSFCETFFFFPHILRMFRKRYEELFWMYNLYIMYMCIELPHIRATALTGIQFSKRSKSTERSKTFDFSQFFMNLFIISLCLLLLYPKQPYPQCTHTVLILQSQERYLGSHGRQYCKISWKIVHLDLV